MKHHTGSTVPCTRVRRGLCLLAVLGLAAGRLPDARAQTASMPAGETAPEQGNLHDIDLFTLEVPKVVTAARREQDLNTVPYAMTVITAEDIRRAGARSVPDALRLAPGMDVAELTYGNYAVSPRAFHGLYANKVLVLVDGRQVFDTLFAGTAWGNWPFQLEDIQRIEVIRGPGGVTWGANAVNGVINIITKDPADQKGLTVRGGGGSQGVTRDHTGYGAQIEKLRLRVSSEYEHSDGFRQDRRLLGNLHDPYEAFRGGVHAVYDAGRNDKLTFSLGSAVVDGNYPAPRLFNPDQRPAGAQSNYVLAKWDHHIEADNDLQLTGYVNDYYNAAVVRWSEYRYQQYALQLGHTIRPGDDHTVTWGVDTRWDVTDTGGADPFMLDRTVVHNFTAGVYGQDEWRFAPRWVLTLGGRVDYDCYGGLQPSGRVSLSYDLNPESLVYAAVSRAFQMLPAAARFNRFPISPPFVYITSREDVDAESLIAYELGYRGRLLDKLTLGLACFWHDYRDVVGGSPKLGPPGLVTLTSDNSYATGLYGVEADLRYALSERVTLLGNYTFQQLDTGVPRQDTISPPEHKFMIAAQYDPVPDLHLSSHLYYVDSVMSPYAANPVMPMHVPPYFRLDLRAEYEFWKRRASLAVGVSNLLQPAHTEGGSTAMDSGRVPRMVYAEMRVCFP